MRNNPLSPHPTIYKWDRAWLGIVLGLIVPFAGIFIVYMISVGAHFFGEGQPGIIAFQTILHSMRDTSMLIRYMSVGCVLNLGVFYLFINKDYFNAGRGVILATIIIAIPVMLGIMRSWFL